MSTAISTKDSIERLLADCSLERGRLLPEGDSRRTLRRRMFKGASLHFNDGTSSIECLVRNLSGHGVMVELDPLSPLPEAFVFRLTGDDRLRHAELVWRQGEKAGIRFP